MNKELIRNGGFESGTLDFWDQYAGYTNIQGTVKKHGSYAAEVVCGPASGQLVHRDYIPVRSNELYKLNMWMKNVDAQPTWVWMQFYDADLSHMSDDTYQTFYESGAFDWKELWDYFIVPEGASYMTIETWGTGNGTKYYIDSVSLQHMTGEGLVCKDFEMIKLENSSGLGTINGNTIFSGMWKTAEYGLMVTSLTGTSPTVDAKIVGWDAGAGMWVDVLVFQQKTGVGGEFKTVLSGLGFFQRAEVTKGGTAVTDCDLKVGVLYRR